MDRKLATIREIKELTPIEGADRIERATIDGWHVVVNKGIHKVGDKVIYAEIDSAFPDRPEFEFLRPRHFRIKTIKLRGQISQGICFPLSVIDINNAFIWEIGQDVTELLGIKKYEPYIPIQLAGLVKGNFPSFIPKTDEERIQNIPYILEEFKGKRFYVTEKLDGTSMTCYYKDGEFGVCSRNLELKETEGNIYWKVARQLKLEDMLSSYGEDLAIQGELIGVGIQKNRYKLGWNEFRIFNIFNINTGKYFEYFDMLNFIQDNELETVPMLGNYFVLNHTMDNLLKMADGISVFGCNIQREGIVFRSIPETHYPGLGRVSFKAISNKYLLKEE